MEDLSKQNDLNKMQKLIEFLDLTVSKFMFETEQGKQFKSQLDSSIEQVIKPKARETYKSIKNDTSSHNTN